VNSSEAIAIDNCTTPLQVTGNLEQRTTRQTFFHPGNAVNFEAEYAIEPTEIKVIDSHTNYVAER
jgi:hypothetical protein